MESNEVLDRLPRHLNNLIIDQPYAAYTAQDHAIWRYIMRQNVKYLPEVAHSSYLQGLRSTGISIDCIPEMYGMNRILKEIGWAAVAVDGFIPPSAFMEFQAYNVLVIAADIRPINQVLYTPAPDIIHEAAGHAPIIADAEYSSYLKQFGIAGTLAFSSSYDTKVYQAIRHLSILKADPYSSSETIQDAEAELDALSKHQSSPSEMALLRNLHWWTVEYGLIGEINRPKIYGAGLLSSIGESHNCLKPSVKKLPYTLEAMNYSFDITTQQPQLFVTPDFETLGAVLEQYLDTMAVRKGGKEALNKALDSGTVSTVVYNSGLQVSGVLAKIFYSKSEAAYLSFTGPVLLAENNKQLDGQGVNYHSTGFGSPVGGLKNFDIGIEYLSEGELSSQGIETGKILQFEFISGVVVKGALRKITRHEGKNLIFTFDDCLVTFEGKVLFDPGWGPYDMAIGSSIISAFSGPADADAFGLIFPAPEEKTHHIQHSGNTLILHQLYSKVRHIREKKAGNSDLPAIWEKVKNNFDDEWLLMLELAEESKTDSSVNHMHTEIMTHLNELAQESDELKTLIRDGLEINS